MGNRTNKRDVTTNGKKLVGGFTSYISGMINELRVIPRTMAICWIWMCYESWNWFAIQEDISTGQGAFLAAIIASASAFCKFYISDHKDIHVHERDKPKKSYNEDEWD